MPFLAVFFVAFFISLALTPVAHRLSHRLGTVAEPGGRRRHHGRIAKLGGLPLMVATLAAIGVARWLLPASGSDVGLLRGVVLGTLLVGAAAVLDDYWELPPWVLFLIQLVGVFMAMWHEVFIERFTNPFNGQEQVIQWTWLVFLLTLFWIMGMINTVNFLDGLDGLAAGVGTIAALVFAWHSYRLGQSSVAAFPLALAGALLGFLPANFPPARIFLGSAGAYFLGYQLATLSIISPAKIATALLVMAVPILDVAWRIVDRLRHGRSPFHGDRGHLHYLLFDMGLPARRIVLGYYAVSLSFGLVAIFVTQPVVKLGILIGLSAAVLTLLIWLSAASNHPAIGEDS